MTGIGAGDSYWAVIWQESEEERSICSKVSSPPDTRSREAGRASLTTDNPVRMDRAVDPSVGYTHGCDWDVLDRSSFAYGLDLSTRLRINTTRCVFLSTSQALLGGGSRA
ncbi:hypothetical protein NPIL_215201 [Nephila pilipes]|uniref:Uncharacterized protein n=1 Tax=Nephila pilipes TaxID=299642 RepID=A0A8X6TSU4_NEPPI|nr:hypothetical protein NPIL_215201 [Nephila pilipes]